MKKRIPSTLAPSPPILDEKALAASLDPTLEPIGKATATVRRDARCLVCGNVTDKAICPHDGNRMGERDE